MAAASRRAPTARPTARGRSALTVAVGLGLAVGPAGPLDLAVAPLAARSSAAAVPATPTFEVPPEPLARFDPQTTCRGAQPGTQRLARLVLSTYPGTRSGGIVRDCRIGGRSEHKEGRAWDWSVDVSFGPDAAAADAFLGWLLATDASGERYANARRLGVMYVVWDRRIWRAYEPGWTAYSGASPHRTHMHISLSRAGAAGTTSFWTGRSGSGAAGRVGPSVGGDVGGGVLREGDRGGEVTRLQGLLGVPADGAFGPRTREAVVAFQRDRGLSPDGVAGPATWAALGAGRAPAPAATPPGGTPTLREGASGPDVVRLQRLLGISADGGFGPQTRAAVQAFQQAARLAVDGVVGPATWRALQSSAAPSPPAPPGPAPGASPTSASGSPVLREGDRGPAVVELQRLLGIGTDGAFGPRTRAAVVAVQSGARLTPDGVVGPRTWAVLGTVTAPAPAPATSGTSSRPVLREGDRGPAVAELQRRLRLPQDGVFGPRTRAGVVAYQSGAGLSADGVVGPRTWAVLLGG